MYGYGEFGEGDPSGFICQNFDIIAHEVATSSLLARTQGRLFASSIVPRIAESVVDRNV